MHRRTFLSSLAAFAAAAALDPEKLLWTPGAKTIFIPQPKWTTTAVILSEAFSVGDLVTFAGRFARHPRTGIPTEYLQYFQVTVSADHSLELKPVPLF